LLLLLEKVGQFQSAVDIQALAIVEAGESGMRSGAFCQHSDLSAIRSLQLDDDRKVDVKLETGHNRSPLERDKAAAARSSRQGSVAALKPKFDVPCLVYIDLAGDSRERCLVIALARHSGD
jgi:hypothetical protein